MQYLPEKEIGLNNANTLPLNGENKNNNCRYN